MLSATAKHEMGEAALISTLVCTVTLGSVMALEPNDHIQTKPYEATKHVVIWLKPHMGSVKIAARNWVCTRKTKLVDQVRTQA